MKQKTKIIRKKSLKNKKVNEYTFIILYVKTLI